MRFFLLPSRSDGGGDLEIVAQSADEVQLMTKHFNLFCDKGCCPDSRMEAIQAEAAALKAGTYDLLLKANPPDKKGTYETAPAWYRIEAALDQQVDRPTWHQKTKGKTWGFMDPYREYLERHTGYTGPLPDINALSGFKMLQATHITEQLWLDGQVLRYKVYVHTGGHNGKSGAAYAERLAFEQVAEEIGGRRHEPEYVAIKGGGLYQHNPNYLRRHPPEPALGADWLWNTLFDWWRLNHASQRQKEILDACDKLHQDSRLEPDYAARYSSHLANFSATYSLNYTLTFLDPQGTCNWDGQGTMVTVMKWEEFKELKENSP